MVFPLLFTKWSRGLSTYRHVLWVLRRISSYSAEQIWRRQLKTGNLTEKHAIILMKVLVTCERRWRAISKWYLLDSFLICGVSQTRTDFTLKPLHIWLLSFHFSIGLDPLRCTCYTIQCCSWWRPYGHQTTCAVYEYGIWSWIILFNHIEAYTAFYGEPQTIEVADVTMPTLGPNQAKEIKCRGYASYVNFSET